LTLYPQPHEQGKQQQYSFGLKEACGGSGQRTGSKQETALPSFIRHGHARNGQQREAIAIHVMANGRP
jgi:hypothetical protein